MTRIGTFYIQVILFAVGTGAAQFSPVLIPVWSLILAAIFVAPCFLLSGLRPVAVLLIGVLWALLRADLALDDEWPSALEGRDVVLIGTIAGLPERGERYLKFDLDVERARFDNQPVGFTGRVRLRWYDAPKRAYAQLKSASKWSLTARLKQPHGYYNPGGFDYEAYLYRQSVRATGYIREAKANTRLVGADGGSLQSLRQVLRDGLDKSMEHVRYRGLLRALALGDRSSISNFEWNTLRATGTSHLIAISGLHVGFAAGIGALLGLWVGRFVSIFHGAVAAPRVGAFSALCFALAYAALSGFEVPAQRAFVMAAVFLLGVLFRRHAWTTRGLCMALVVVLIIEPASVHDPGFWLSFCAVAVILGWIASRENLPAGGRLLEAIKLQWVLSLALLPLVAAFFGVASLVSAPSNMLAVPVVMFSIVPLCLLSVVSVAVGFEAVASVCLGLADEVLGVLWTILDWFASLDYSYVPLQLEVWQSLVLLSGFAWMGLMKHRARNLGLVCVAVLFMPAPSAPGYGEFRVSVLDVGQGLSAVVKTEHHTLIYDTGPRYPSGFSLANAVLIPYLRKQSVATVDVLIISHGDNDHRGGFEDLRSQLPVKRILSSIAHELPDSEYCIEGQRWRWDGVIFEMLHPGDRQSPAHNNASCVIRVSSPHGAVLLTGDIETEVEYSLQRRQDFNLQSDVLLVPHQGSATSSTSSFIDRVNPRWAIVAAGYVNRYGHPRPEIMARYRSRGIIVKNTARAGAVIARVSRDGIRVRGWRESRPRYWLDRDDLAHDRDAI